LKAGTLERSADFGVRSLGIIASQFVSIQPRSRALNHGGTVQAHTIRASHSLRNFHGTRADINADPTWSMWPNQFRTPP
jgi:hypothetical protein